jgi:hypothetical protein
VKKMVCTVTGNAHVEMRDSDSNDDYQAVGIVRDLGCDHSVYPIDQPIAGHGYRPRKHDGVDYNSGFSNDAAKKTRMRTIMMTKTTIMKHEHSSHPLF